MVYFMFFIKAAVHWVLNQYANLYHGFINILRMWFPDSYYLWHYLPIVEEYVASYQLQILSVIAVIALIYWRNTFLSNLIIPTISTIRNVMPQFVIDAVNRYTSILSSTPQIVRRLVDRIKKNH